MILVLMYLVSVACLSPSSHDERPSSYIHRELHQLGFLSPSGGLSPKVLVLASSIVATLATSVVANGPDL